MKLIISKQSVYALALSYMLSFLALLNLGNAILNLCGLHTQLDTIFLYGLLVVLVFAGLFLVITDRSKLKIDCFFLVAFLVISFLLTIFIFPSNTKYIFSSWADYSSNQVYLLFLYSLPGFIFVRYLEDYDIFKRFMCVFSYITLIMSIIVFFFAKESSASQYMTFSYNMLTQLFFLLLHKPKKNHILHYIIVALGLFVFIFGGARGAMISLVVALALLYFLNYKPTITNVLISIFLIIVVVIIVLFKNQILLFISEMLESASIDSRTFRYLMAGDLLDDSNRIPLYKSTINQLSVLGSGIMGDRLVLDSYPHNIILEILFQFGLIVGPILVCLIFGCVGLSLFKKSNPELMFIVLLLPCGFLKLMVTGSYLNQEPSFYILLGFCINSILRNDECANTNVKYSIRSKQYR